MGNPTGFLSISRKNHQSEHAQERVKHWLEFHLQMSEEEIKEQAQEGAYEIVNKGGGRM